MDGRQAEAGRGECDWDPAGEGMGCGAVGAQGREPPPRCARKWPSWRRPIPARDTPPPSHRGPGPPGVFFFCFLPLVRSASLRQSVRRGAAWRLPAIGVNSLGPFGGGGGGVSQSWKATGRGRWPAGSDSARSARCVRWQRGRGRAMPGAVRRRCADERIPRASCYRDRASEGAAGACGRSRARGGGAGSPRTDEEEFPCAHVGGGPVTFGGALLFARGFGRLVWFALVFYFGAFFLSGNLAWHGVAWASGAGFGHGGGGMRAAADGDGESNRGRDLGVDGDARRFWAFKHGVVVLSGSPSGPCA